MPFELPIRPFFFPVDVPRLLDDVCVAVGSWKSGGSDLTWVVVGRFWALLVHLGRVTVDGAREMSMGSVLTLIGVTDEARPETEVSRDEDIDSVSDATFVMILSRVLWKIYQLAEETTSVRGTYPDRVREYVASGNVSGVSDATVNAGDA